MKILVHRSTVANGKRIVLKDPKKPVTIEVSDSEGRLLINLGKAKPAKKAE